MAIATILTAYLSALTFSNQAIAQSAARPSTVTSGINFYFGGNFLAQPSNGGSVSSNQAQLEGQNAGVDGGTGHVIQSDIGKVLGGTQGNHIQEQLLTGHLRQATQAALGDVCLSCWGGR